MGGGEVAVANALVKEGKEGHSAHIIALLTRAYDQFSVFFPFFSFFSLIICFFVSLFFCFLFDKQNLRNGKKLAVCCCTLRRKSLRSIITQNTIPMQKIYLFELQRFFTMTE